MANLNEVHWNRIAIEVVAIIGSILLAFAIDAWWEDRQDRFDERNYLVSLRQEFADGLDLAKYSEDLRQQTVAAHLSLIAQIQGEKRAPDSDLYIWISNVSYPMRFVPPRAVFNDIVASGRTLLIRSDDLRIALAEFEQGLRYLEQEDNYSWAVWEQRLQPLLEGRIPRVERLRQGVRANFEDVPFGESPHAADFDGVFADPRFEDMLAERWLRLQNGVYGIRRLIDRAEDILRMIDDQLQSE